MKHVFPFLLLLVLVSCAGKKTESHDSDANGGSETTTPTTSPTSGGESAKMQSEVMGTYTGMFIPQDGKGLQNKITIALNELAADGGLKGNSIVSGNNRPFSGTYKKEGDAVVCTVKEPGDDPYDGVFEFTVIPSTKKLTGKWTPNDKKLKPKTYNLAYRQFVYNTKDGNSAYASTNVLSTGELENMAKADLRLMRNEIYARHGYAFKMKDMRAYFDNQEWYMPLHTDIRNMLTEVEKKNVELIKRYEKYAAEYYDTFGR